MNIELKEWIKRYDKLSEEYDRLKHVYEYTVKNIIELRNLNGIPQDPVTPESQRPLIYAIRNGHAYHAITDDKKIIDAYTPPNKNWLYADSEVIGIHLKELLPDEQIEKMMYYRRLAKHKLFPVDHICVGKRGNIRAVRRIMTCPWTSKYATMHICIHNAYQSPNKR